jgi:hypothetical protein
MDPKPTLPAPPTATVEEQLKASFPKFLWYVWTRVLSLPQPTRIQYDIARFLEGGPRKRFIAAFRGVGKTFLTGAYVVWRLWREPNLKVMVVSANERFASKVAAFVHALINAEDILTRELVPWSELAARGGQKNSVMEFDVGTSALSKDPSVFAVGITGQMTGGRADLILSDDIEVPGNSETEGQREKLEDRTGEFAAILKPGGEVIYLGTFQSMQSVYRRLRDKGYAMRLWPARYPRQDKQHLYAETLAPLLLQDLKETIGLSKSSGTSLGGKPTDPERFTEEDLLEREAEWGKAGFQLQFMLDTSLSDAERFPLKTRDLIVMDVPLERAPIHLAWGSAPQQLVREIDNVGFDGDRFFRPMHVAEEFKEFTGSLLEIDPSGRGADETGYIVTKFLNGKVFIRQWSGFQDGHSEATLGALAKIAVDEKVGLIRVEGNFGDGMFSRLLETHLRRVGFKGRVEDHKVSGQKEVRILNLVRPALEGHRIVIDTAVAHKDISAARVASERQGRAGTAALEFSALYQLTHMSSQRRALRKDGRLGSGRPL